MIPIRIVEVHEFPLNIIGKVGRSALLSRQVLTTSNGKLAEESLEPELSDLTAMVREVLEIDTVTPDEGVIERGRDSLSATPISRSFRVRTAAAYVVAEVR